MGRTERTSREEQKDKKNAGESMVEVLVAFVVSMLMVVLFSQVVNVSATFLNSSLAMSENLTKFEERFYKKNAAELMTDISGRWYLRLDRERTDEKNCAGQEEVELELGGVSLKRYEDSECNIRRYVIKTE